MKRILFILLPVFCLFLFACAEPTRPSVTEPIGSGTPGAETTTGAGGTETAAEAFFFQLSEDGAGYRLCGVGACRDADLVLPDEYRGKPVVSVDGGAFCDLSWLKTLTVPEGIREIGGEAFSGCGALRSVSLPASLISLGEAAFSGCPMLEEVSVSPDNPVYHSAGNCLIDTAQKMLVLGCRTSEIPADGTVTVIGRSAFRGSSAMETVTVPESVTAIGHNAFSGCDALKTLCYRGRESDWQRVAVSYTDGVLQRVEIVFDPVVSLGITEVSAKTVRHLFTHCLILDPKKGCSYAGAPLDADCLTVSEFSALLESLYEKGFCLIDINDMFAEDAEGRVGLADTVRVYEGKRPLVISIDDVTYDPKKKGSGMADRLVIDGGTIKACFDREDGTSVLSEEECFSLIERFVAEHPDFSFEGSKVTLALTGFAGILGYRTDEEYAGRYDVEKERREAQTVVDWLKAHGYSFACHSYSHADYSSCSLGLVQEDIRLWEQNVAPLIGETKIFVYPYGGFTYQGTAKHQALFDAGFRVFCGTSQTNALWDDAQPGVNGIARGTGTVYLERFTVTGFTLRQYASRTNYRDYYIRYYKQSGYSPEEAEEKAERQLARSFESGRQNSLEYYTPEKIYDHENRYEKILPENG
ncbi:MAG: leucine-rich repeat protein [Clostridia bacterium]|nr:leucine-rich repeat protein [Clostridia bacterium]